MSKYMDLLAKVQQVSCTLFLPLDLSQVLSTTISLETLMGGVKSTASGLLPNLGLALLQGLLLMEVGRGGGERERWITEGWYFPDREENCYIY